jgi:hypothetical protein
MLYEGRLKRKYYLNMYINESDIIKSSVCEYLFSSLEIDIISLIIDN